MRTLSVYLMNLSVNVLVTIEVNCVSMVNSVYPTLVNMEVLALKDQLRMNVFASKVSVVSYCGFCAPND